jgi:NAD(P)-dependent dehydrogenase (short-subunit alcohol dehydrogenase family)
VKPDLSGQKVMISGAGRGLGAAMAEYLGSCGMVVAVCDIDEATSATVAANIVAAGGTATAYHADLGSRQSFLDVGAAFAGRYGPIDAVINNASVLVYEPIENVTEDTLERMISAGLKSVFWGTQAFLANHAEGTPGAIINMSSPVAYRGRANTGAYSAIKGAIAALTMVLAGELGPRGIRVNAVAPGSVPTPATLGFVSEADYEKRAKSIPLRRLGRTDDIANAVGFLLSKEASFVNGAMLSVDGGIIAAG